MKEEEVTWKTILYDLVKSEEMNPWDIDIKVLSKKYLQIIKEMKEHDLKISGKILLAAAILLKIKSTHLIDNDIANLDRLISQTEEEFSDEEPIEDFSVSSEKKEREKFKLIPRNPQPRSRKVSIHDLVEALQKAMESKKRTLAKQRPVKFVMPKRGIDIMEVIRDIYHKIAYYSDKKQLKKITFTQLLPPRAGKQEKVYTFLPLLHLENQQKVETSQKEPFDEIFVEMVKGKVKKR